MTAQLLPDIKGILSSRWLEQWLKRRLPEQRSIKLTRKNIFIFPSHAGFMFLLGVALLWLVATNYENNLIMGFTFLLISLFVVSILHTFSNLSSINISAVNGNPAFVGEDVEFTLMVTCNDHRNHENLQFSWSGEAPQIINLTDQRQQVLRLYLRADKRGLFKPPRLLVETCYPLGLLRAWSWLYFDISCLIYPRPIQSAPVYATSGSEAQTNSSEFSGTEDFFGLRNYQPGDALKHLAWKQLAKGRGLVTREYSAGADRQLWLDWDYLAGMNRESRLSRLCYWVLEAARGQEPYGLRLPGIEIAPDKGTFHRDRLLKALALFESDRCAG